MPFNDAVLDFLLGFSKRRRGGEVRVLGIPFLVTLLAALSFPGPADAQSRSRDRDPSLSQIKALASEIQSANMRWGPFYLLSRFQVSDVGVNYDYNLPTDNGGLGVSLSIAAPQKLFLVPHKKLIFTLEGIPAYTFFYGEKGDGQFDYEVNADGHLLLNHAYVNFFVLGSDRLRPQPADFYRMATVKETGFGADADIKFSSRTSLALGGDRKEFSYPGGSRYQPEAVPIDLLSREELNARATLHHKTFPLTSLQLTVDATEYEFTKASYKDATRLRVLPGLHYQGSKYDVSAEAGPTSLTHRDTSQQDYSAITGNVAVSRGFGRWGANAGYARDLGLSIMEANNYYVADRVHAQLTYSATTRLSLGARFTGEVDDYPVEVRGIRREDEITFTTVGFRYSRWKLSGGFDVGPYRRTSTLGDSESEIRWVLNLSLNL